MRIFVLLLSGLAAALSLCAQDSLHYSVMWTPKHAYRKAGVKQEGVFLHPYRDGAPADSFLTQVMLYDEDGQILQRQNYRLNKLRNRLTYYYSANRLDSMVQEELWLPATVVHKYFYDDAGDLVLQESFNGAAKNMQVRYVYNGRHQLVERFTQIGRSKEFLSARYAYRPDGLLRQIDFLFGKGASADDFTCFYKYTDNNRTVTCSFQQASSDRRYIDCIKTYDEQDRLIEKLNPPLSQNGWLPLDVHPRNDEETEQFIYLPNGMLQEKQIRVDEKIKSVEKHIYF